MPVLPIAALQAQANKQIIICELTPDSGHGGATSGGAIAAGSVQPRHSVIIPLRRDFGCSRASRSWMFVERSAAARWQLHAHSPKTLRVGPITRRHRDCRIVSRRKTVTRWRINLTVLLSCFTNINGLVHVGVPLGNELRPTEELQARSNRRFAFAHLAWLVNGSIYIRLLKTI